MVAPAVKQAEQGFVVRPHVHYWWTHGADMGRVEVQANHLNDQVLVRYYASDWERYNR